LTAAVLAASVSPDFVAGPGGQLGTVSAGRATYVTAEGGSVRVAVSVTTPAGGPLSAPVTVGYTTGTGSATAWVDYRPVYGTLVFPAGARSGITETFAVRTFCDGLSETVETVPVSLSSGTIGVSVNPHQPTIVIVPTRSHPQPRCPPAPDPGRPAARN
jgi:beta-glucosidase